MTADHATPSASPAARARDGVSIAYSLRGSARSGRRYVLVHTLALDRTVWAPVADRLAADAEVLTYDCRGHGASGRPEGPYSVHLFADDLAALLDEVGWASAIVAGASMGGSVAQAFATTYPQRVAALGLVDTTAWYGPQAPQQWETRARQAIEQGLESLIGFQLTRWFGDAYREDHPEVLSHLTDVFLANDVTCYATTCRMMGAFDLREAVSGLRVPASILVGEEDYATPPDMARWIHEAIPGSSLEILPATRHLSLLERPDEVASMLRGLAARVG